MNVETEGRVSVRVDEQGEEQPVLSIRDLSVTFPDGSRAVSEINLDIARGEVVGVAGQSGSGKSMTALSTIGLAPSTAHITGSIRFDGVELLSLPERERAAYRGRRVTMIFQETITALNPVVPVERQLVLAVRANSKATKGEALTKAREALRAVKLHDVERVMRSYPHQLSGGMCQRVMIAMALACGSELLLADEPTTALDVTVQREILEILRTVVEERGMSVLLISHDLGVLEEVTNSLVIMRHGRVVESGATAEVMKNPQHSYTQALLRSIPRINGVKGRFVAMDEFEEDVADTDGVATRARWWRR